MEGLHIGERVRYSYQPAIVVDRLMRYEKPAIVQVRLEAGGLRWAVEDDLIGSRNDDDLHVVPASAPAA